jgi:DNA-binding NtrC family response regulator
MRFMDVVVAHGDKKSAQILAESLNKVFRSVSVVGTADELSAAVAQKQAQLAITDLETIDFGHVEQLQTRFGIDVVCTHRIPDDEMWAKALSHGAIDCCQISDVKATIAAVTRNSRLHAA